MRLFKPLRICHADNTDDGFFPETRIFVPCRITNERSLQILDRGADLGHARWDFPMYSIKRLRLNSGYAPQRFLSMVAAGHDHQQRCPSSAASSISLSCFAICSWSAVVPAPLELSHVVCRQIWRRLRAEAAGWRLWGFSGIHPSGHLEGKA
jgi:hypothetical protein